MKAVLAATASLAVIVFAASSMLSVTRVAPDAAIASPMAGKMYTLLHWAIGTRFAPHSTGAKGEPVAISARPSVHFMRSAGVASAGIFSIAFRDKDHGVIVGGDYEKPGDAGATAAVTADGGKTWNLIDPPLPYRSAVAWSKDRWVAVGTSGAHASTDGGKTWKVLATEKYNSVAFARDGEGWAAGPKGRIAKFVR